MFLDLKSDKPIYLQLAEAIEDQILKEIFIEESQIPSTTEMSVMFKINPATAAKGVNLLVQEGILYKKRGVGMFVCHGAVKKVRDKRKERFYQAYVIAMLEEASKLGIAKEEIIQWIERR